MDKKVSKGLPAFIGVAAVWMGTHFGPGVASGTQIITYYVKFGIPGILCAVFAMCLLGAALYCSMEASRIYKTYEYQSWAKNIWDFSFTKSWIVWLFDLSFLITIMTALGGSLNAVATLMQNQWGLNYWFGIILVIAMTMFLCAYGADLVRKASSYMMFFVVGILLVIVVLLVVKGDGNLGAAIASQKSNPGITINVPNSIWQAIVYAAFQATVVANIASVADTLKSRSDSKKAAITGIIANAALLVILGLVLFSYTSVEGFNILDQKENPLPFFALLQRLGYNWLTVVYILIVTVAVLSTAVGFSFAGVARFGKYYQVKSGKSSSLRDAAFVGVMLLLCAFASRLGIVALVKTGYTALGYVNLPVILLSALFLGGRKISKKYLKENNIDAPGID